MDAGCFDGWWVHFHTRPGAAARLDAGRSPPVVCLFRCPVMVVARLVLWMVVLHVGSLPGATRCCPVPFGQDDVTALRASAAAALQQLEEAGGGSAAGVVAQVRGSGVGRVLLGCSQLACRITSAWGQRGRHSGPSQQGQHECCCAAVVVQLLMLAC